MPRSLKLIIIGFGAVGRGLAEILSGYSLEVARQCGVDLKTVAVIDRGGAAISEKEGVNLQKALETKNQGKSVSSLRNVGKPCCSALEVLEQVNADIVVEVTPTNIQTGEPGLTHIKKTLSQGKHLITSNKGPIVLALPDLTALAKKNNACLRFSGTVGAGMPILNLVKCFRNDKVLSLRGVLNATTNYVLWKVAKEHITVEKALIEARSLGYAEANCSNDVDGIDTACKLVILSNVAMNRPARLGDVKIQGIREITLQEIIAADKENYALRLVGSIDKRITVSPQKMSKNDPLYVESALNAVTFYCTYTGYHTLIGKGAGGHETAGSIMRDLMDISQKLKTNDRSIG